MATTSPITSPLPSGRWMTKSPTCQRDLLIKKIACTIIVSANLAALGTLLAYVIMYCPLSTEVLVIAPVVGGVIGALTYLKVPIKGINETNYENYLTPAFVVARTLTVLCFAPTVIAIRRLDWTNYADPYEAHRIVEELKHLEKEEIVKKYGPKADNLDRYGILEEKEAVQLKTLYKAAKASLQTQEFLEKEKAPQSALQKNASILTTHFQDWSSLHQSIQYTLPQIDPPTPDHSLTSTKIKLWIREYLGFYLFNTHEEAHAH